MAFKVKVQTLCDFGQPGRITVIGNHKSIATAMRQYARIWDIYGRRGTYRVWQKSIEPNNKKGA